jgi:hypothetical protein
MIRSRFALDNGAEAMHAIRQAQLLAKLDGGRAWAALNEIFRAGHVPNLPLDGRYAGELIALQVAPGVTQFGRAVAAAWLPWKGKAFYSAQARGDNLFTRDSLTLAHVFWPFYRGYVDDASAIYRAFAFNTRIDAGLFDYDREVLKIDYALPENPAATVRRVLDELVQVSDTFYLGKAHVKWWWGKWQTVAYFTLAGDASR